MNLQNVKKLKIKHYFRLVSVMPTPPCYVDLGKNARDIFGKGYRKFKTTILKPYRGWVILSTNLKTMIFLRAHVCT